MLNRIASKITVKMIRQGIFTEEMYDIYVYGFQLVLSFLLSVAVMLLIGVATNRVLNAILFLVVFVALRSFTGGYHANTYGVCFLVTISVFVITLLLSEYISIHWFSYFLLIIVGLPILYIWAPVEHHNKPLDNDDKARCKMISIILFLSFNIVGMFFTIVNASLGAVMFFTLVTDLFLLFVKSKEGGRTT